MNLLLPLLAAASWLTVRTPAADDYDQAPDGDLTGWAPAEPKDGEPVVLPAAGVVATLKKSRFVLPIFLTLLTAWQYFQNR